MQIHFLGTGSAYPGRERDNTSLCIATSHYQVLVDVSGNPCKKLKQKNIDLQAIDSVILTHFHIDHVYGLPSLLWGMWLEHRKKPLHIYCELTCKAKLHEWLRAMGIDEWGIEFPIHIETFDGSHKEILIETGNLQLSCFPALHSVPTIGLEITYEDKVVIYSGDSEVNDLINAYERIDVLVHEATFASKQETYHSSIKEIVDAYDLTRIGKTVFIHLSDLEPYEEVLSDLPEEILEKCALAEDMETIRI